MIARLCEKQNPKRGLALRVTLRRTAVAHLTAIDSLQRMKA